MKFILFEGVDGSGKTTLAKKLADRIGGIYYDSPPECIRNLRKSVITSDEIRLQYYLLGNIIASEEIKRILQTDHVICDRYIYSTIADHSVRLERDISIPYSLVFPDYIVYTRSNLRTIEERLLKRDGKIKKGEIEFLDKVARKMESIFKDQDNVFYLDTSNKNPEELIDLILKNLSLNT